MGMKNLTIVARNKRSQSEDLHSVKCFKDVLDSE